MIFNFSIKKVDSKTNKPISIIKIRTNDWYEIEKFWEQTGIDKYEDIEYAHESITEKGVYGLYCDTDFMLNDGCLVVIEMSTENN